MPQVQRGIDFREVGLKEPSPFKWIWRIGITISVVAIVFIVFKILEAALLGRL